MKNNGHSRNNGQNECKTCPGDEDRALIREEIPIGGLISIIHRMFGIYLNNSLTQEDMTAGQIPFIMKLSFDPGCTQDEMAEHFLIDKGTVARAVRKMEDNGIIIREQDSDNRRKYHLYLTAKGKQIVPQIHEIDRLWEDKLLFGLSTEDKEKTFQALRMLAEKSHKCARSFEEIKVRKN